MSSNDLLLTLVVDRSGSMAPLADATIEGINSLLAEQAKIDGNCYVSLVLFNGEFDVRYVAWNVADVPPMAKTGPNAYVASGTTNLYDAIGVGVEGSEQWLKNNPWFDGQKLVVIWTDGEQVVYNPRWSLDVINKLIDLKQKKGWIFQFMGTGGAAWTEAKHFTAIPVANFAYTAATSDSLSTSYAGVTASVSTLRSTGNYVAPPSDTTSG